MRWIADIYSMCGIAGIISVNEQLITTDRLQRMTRAISHRGPDGAKHWTNPACTAGLGHRRLAIIDLSADAAQPMHYLSRYSIVHNGEIYNYIELRDDLAAKGYRFTTESDTEVLLAAYDCWKQDCLQHFDGMFAFAIWDEKEQTLFAARDRFGEKPFFYWFNGQELVFASEMKALWAAGIEKKLNQQLLFNFITLGYTQNPANPLETAYLHINKLPAASFFTYRLREQASIEPVAYWRLDPSSINNTISEENAVDQFNDMFVQSVKKRLRSDVPLGTSLSGGLDSSSIAVMISHLQRSGFRLQTFSAIFPGFVSDESRFIEMLVTKQEIDNFTVHPTADNFINDFEKLCYFQEGYMGSASVYAQYKVFELARQHNTKVLLDGQGADEILAGYHKYYHWYWQELYQKDRTMLQVEISAARQLGVAEPWNWKNKLSAAYPVSAGKYIKKMRIQKQMDTAGIRKDFAGAYGTSYYQLPAQDKLSNVLYYNTFNNGLEELLQYADHNSMAHGREVRLPFLQHELVEFVFSLPSHFKIKSGHTKWLLRKAMDNKLPEEITWRKDKIGFEPPQKAWMQQPQMQEYQQEAIGKLVKAGVLKQGYNHKKNQPLDANAADNFNWRYLVAAQLF
ncbi:MAG: asparagine synthase (glutamine-hydrolyzing) [Chitinophagaceae bacterium]